MPTSLQSTQHALTATFDRNEPLTTAMLTTAFVNEATRAIRNARDSVEAGNTGTLYVPTVRKIVENVGFGAMEAFIVARLTALNIALNLARQMTAPMMEISAPLIVSHILDDDCDVTLADLRIIFDRAMFGQYGDFYNGIGLADIVGWIDSYIAEKCMEYERWHHNLYYKPRQ